jgi:hypothetical protein
MLYDMLFHHNNGCTNAPQCCVIPKLALSLCLFTVLIPTHKQYHKRQLWERLASQETQTVQYISQIDINKHIKVLQESCKMTHSTYLEKNLPCEAPFWSHYLKSQTENLLSCVANWIKEMNVSADVLRRHTKSLANANTDGRTHQILRVQTLFKYGF